MQKNEVRTFPNAIHKDMDYSKWIKDLNIRPETIKFLDENIGRPHFDTNHGKILYDSPPRVTEIKTKINKWDLIKLENFFTVKKTIQVKRQPSEW